VVIVIKITYCPIHQGANNTWWRRDAEKKGGNMYQSRFKKVAMMKEFKGVQKLLKKLGRDIDEFDSIVVKRIDENFLNSFPSCYSWDGSAGATEEWTKLYAVMDYAGDCGIKEIAIDCKGISGSNYAYSPRHEYDGETYLESLARVENIDDYSYFIRYFRRYSDWSGQESEDTRELTILKLPKKKTITEIMKEAVKRAEEEVKTEIDF